MQSDSTGSAQQQTPTKIKGIPKLKSLTLSNFRTFIGKTTIVLPNSGLFMIKGQNGSGKSNILLSLAYLLGYCRLPVKALQSWNTPSMFVEGVFEFQDGSKLEIHRGTNGTYCQWDGQQKVAGAVKAVNDEIARAFGMAPQMLELLGYRDQMAPGSFLVLDDRQLKEKLCEMLGIGVIESELDLRSEGLKSIKDRFLASQQRAEDAQKRLADAQSAKVTYTNIDTTPIEAEVSELETALTKGQKLASEYSEELAKLEQQRKAIKPVDLKLPNMPLFRNPDTSDLDKNLDQCEDFIESLEQDHRDALALVAKERREISAQIKAIGDELIKIGDVNASILELEKQLKKAESNTCYACGQTLAATNKLVQELNAAILNKKNSAKRNQVLERDRQELMERYDKAVDPKMSDELIALNAIKLDLIKKKDSAIKDAKIEYSAKLAKFSEEKAALQDAAHKAVAAEISAVTDIIATVRAKHETCLKDIAATLALLQEKKAQISSINVKNVESRVRAEESEKAIRLLEEQALTYAAALKESEAEFHAESDYLNLIKGFRDKIFDETLYNISEEANEILSQVQNTQGVSVTFSSEQVTDSGKVNFRIKPVVYIDGVARSPKDTLSGGQLMTLNLAVDLAVIKVGGMRCGGGIGWIILDEYFHRLDGGSMQVCLDILAKYGMDKLIVIVEHAEEFQDAFESTITVSKTEKGSHVKYSEN